MFLSFTFLLSLRCTNFEAEIWNVVPHFESNLLYPTHFWLTLTRYIYYYNIKPFHPSYVKQNLFHWSIEYNKNDFVLLCPIHKEQELCSFIPSIPSREQKLAMSVTSGIRFELQNILRYHTKPINHLAISPDYSRLISIGTPFCPCLSFADTWIIRWRC